MAGRARNAPAQSGQSATRTRLPWKLISLPRANGSNGAARRTLWGQSTFSCQPPVSTLRFVKPSRILTVATILRDRSVPKGSGQSGLQSVLVLHTMERGDRVQMGLSPPALSSYLYRAATQSGKLDVFCINWKHQFIHRFVQGRALKQY